MKKPKKEKLYTCEFCGCDVSESRIVNGRIKLCKLCSAAHGSLYVKIVSDLTIQMRHISRVGNTILDAIENKEG